MARRPRPFAAAALLASALACLPGCRSADDPRADPLAVRPENRPAGAVPADSSNLRPPADPSHAPTFEFPGLRLPERYVVTAAGLGYALDFDLLVFPFWSRFEPDPATGRPRLVFVFAPLVVVAPHDGPGPAGEERPLLIFETSANRLEPPSFHDREFLGRPAARAPASAPARLTCPVEVAELLVVVGFVEHLPLKNTQYGVLTMRVLVRADGLVQYSRTGDDWYHDGEPRWASPDPKLDEAVTVRPPVGHLPGSTVVPPLAGNQRDLPRVVIDERYLVTCRPLYGLHHKTYVLNIEVHVQPFVSELVTDPDTGRARLSFVRRPNVTFRQQVGARRTAGGDQAFILVPDGLHTRVNDLPLHVAPHGECDVEHLWADLSFKFVKSPVTHELGTMALCVEVRADGAVIYTPFVASWQGEGDARWGSGRSERIGDERVIRSAVSGPSPRTTAPSSASPRTP